MILLDEQWMVVDTVSSSNRASSCESIEHSVSDCSVAPDGDNEFFSIVLTNLPPRIHHLLFVVRHHDPCPPNENVRIS